MSPYPLVPLGNLLKVHYGKALKAEERDDDGIYDVYGSSGKIGNHHTVLVKHPTLIIGRKGSVGAVTYAPNGGWTIDTAFYTEILDPKLLDLRFLFYALNRAKLAQYTITTSIPGLNRDDIYSTQIPLPPLPEQKRIAAILDKADAIRRKRQQAVKLTEELMRSVFLDMFGDPVTNPKGWPKTKLSEVVNGKYGIKAGPFGSSLKKEDYTASGYRIYGQEQVIAGRFDVGDYYIGERKFQQLKGCEVAEGDLLVSLVGSFGKVLVVASGVEPGIINPRLLKITPNCNFVTSIFLAAIIEDTSIQAEFERMAHGGTMGILNVGLLKQLDVILPPLERQYEFASRLKAIKNMKNNLQISCTTSDTLFTSLLQRAFRGEL